MVTATVVFLVAALVGHGGYAERDVTPAGLVLTVVGFGFLTVGGWLGGSVVYVHGMRVLADEDKPAREAVKPDASDDPPARTRAGVTRPGGEDA